MRGLAKATIRLRQAIQDIVEERAPITVRGIAYGLFVGGFIPSMETRDTQKVSRNATAMREDGDLDWRDIVDDSRVPSRALVWTDIDERIHHAASGYRKDYWQDQPTIVEVWSEKATVKGVLQPVLDKWGVTFRNLKGFGSFTSVKQAAEESLHNYFNEQSTHILYIGDHDPSGLYMSEVDLPRRLERYGASLSMQRVAVTAQDFHLPKFSADTKKKDKRYPWFVDRFGKDCWELDAIDPNDLRERVSEQIESCINLLRWERMVSVEQAEMESMRDFLTKWRSA